MKTLKLYYIWLVLALNPINISGEEDNTEKLIQMAKELGELKNAQKQAEAEITGFKKEKSDLEKQLKTIQSEKEKLQQKVQQHTETEKNLNKEKKTIVEPLNKRIAELQNVVDSLSGLLRDRQQLHEHELSEVSQKIMSQQTLRTDSLEKEILKLQTQNKELQKENSELKADNEKKDNHLKDLEVFEAEYLAKLSNSFDDDWSSKAYSEMSSESLQELKEMCEKYSDRDNRLKVAADKFGSLQNELSAFNEAITLLNEPYNYEKASVVLSKLNSAEKSATESHRKELKKAIKDLSDYRIAAITLKIIIEEINERAGKFGNHNASWIPVKEYIDELEKEGELYTIKNNPWLSVKYQEYLKEITKNCKEQGPVQKAIMELNTEE